MDEFRNDYNGDVITSYEVKVTQSEADQLTQMMEYSSQNPGNYSIYGQNCTSFAVQKLSNIGVNIYTSSGCNVINGYWCTPNTLNTALQYKVNSATFINRTRFQISTDKP